MENLYNQNREQNNITKIFIYVFHKSINIPIKWNNHVVKEKIE